MMFDLLLSIIRSLAFYRCRRVFSVDLIHRLDKTLRGRDFQFENRMS